MSSSLKIRRALITVSDKAGISELGRALQESGAELVATGRTASALTDSGLKVTPIEKISGSPEAFQGRMKTLSFPVCSGILYRRGDSSDETDLERLKIQPIDCVVVNFYPFEKKAAEVGRDLKSLVEEIDVGGPTLVRAAAKNAPDVLVLTSPTQYSAVVNYLGKEGQVPHSFVQACASQAWERIFSYDHAIAREFGTSAKKILRYGENPHQSGFLEFDPEGPIAWGEALGASELSYNNILDLSSAYQVASDLKAMNSSATSVVVIKHNGPCGVAMVPGLSEEAQLAALTRAWEGDPVSAFGGVLVFTDPIWGQAASRLAEKFVDCIGAPGLQRGDLQYKTLSAKRKNLKAVPFRRWGEISPEMTVAVPGGRLFQTQDQGIEGDFKCVTRAPWPQEKRELVKFGISVCRALKSNAIALVREIPGASGGFQLVGAGQGQPNRIEALKALAVPRAQNVLSSSAGKIEDCVMVSDAFFPFRDTVDVAHSAGIRYIVQPGGSLRDAESITACDEHGIAMIFTGTRHFRH